ncbi:uncharacterized protein LOC111021802 [Momordica charantia]|uniref:Uncharacterized protein LOC111021802 n=1 Tax=Momordica charantia TaxID=3673 RepID=A0A6J1DP34_MOMCH|nr:uncharacterized protein LOC111021802 [Momordica charantia]
MFRKTTFCHLLDVDLVFNGSLIHNILLREVEESTPNTISFNLFRRRMSFERTKFHLISGLKYVRTPVRENTLPHRLMTLYFNDKTDLVLSDFEKMYTAARFEDDYDVVKVLIVYMVGIGLLGRERMVKFDHTLLGIVDDWEVCCNYNWASLSFEKTINSLQRGPLKMSKDGKLRKSYSLYGFPWVFQVWAYDTISSLSMRVANKVLYDTVPHIFKWRYDHSTAWHVLDRDIFCSTKGRTRTLDETDVETSFLNRSFDPPVSDDDDVMEERGDNAGPSAVREGSQYDDESRGADVEMVEKDAELENEETKGKNKVCISTGRLKRVEKCLKSMDKRMDERMGDIEAELKSIKKFL